MRRGARLPGLASGTWSQLCASCDMPGAGRGAETQTDIFCLLQPFKPASHFQGTCMMPDGADKAKWPWGSSTFLATVGTVELAGKCPKCRSLGHSCPCLQAPHIHPPAHTSIHPTFAVCLLRLSRLPALPWEQSCGQTVMISSDRSCD